MLPRERGRVSSDFKDEGVPLGTAAGFSLHI